jgi:hypothetical protein
MDQHPGADQPLAADAVRQRAGAQLRGAQLRNAQKAEQSAPSKPIWVRVGPCEENRIGNRPQATAATRALKTPTGINPDQIIEIKELRFEESELKTAETGAEVAKILRFDGDGGTYTIGFRARMRGQGAWRFCSKCRALFWNGHKDRKGVCPSGGSHVAQGLTFFLPHDRPIRPKEERSSHANPQLARTGGYSPRALGDCTEVRCPQIALRRLRGTG